MALLADRVKESTTTTGTGTVSLAGAPAGFQSFNTAFANASLVYYVIQGGAEWEIGIGTVGTGTLARTTVLQSSNADALVPFSAGVKDVFCSYVADRAVTTVDAATLTNKTIDDYTNNVGANSTHFRIKAGATLAKGDVVKASGFTPGEAAIEVVKTASATDVAIGIVEQALSTGQFGTAVVIGELFDVNTNGLSVGATLYQNGAGGYTTTRPASGLFQAIGWVVRANTSNGVIAVNIVNPQYVEASTNTANTLVLRDGSGNFSAGTITATLSGTATQVSQALTAGTYLTSGGTYDGSTARTFAVDATSTNTASKVVARDASGNFAAGTITATLSGNATTATTADKVANALTAGSYLTTTGTFDGSAARTFAVDATDANTASKVVARDASGNFSAGTITAALTGNASTATALQTARNINGVSFNGTADITVTAAAGTLTGTTLASNVVSSSLTSVGTLSSLTVSGNVTVDTNTLFVNASTNRVGIGTASPSATLHVNGPSGVTSFTGTTFLGALVGGASSTNDYSGIDFSDAGNVVKARIASYFSGAGSYLQFGTSNNYGTGVTNTAMSIDPSGNLAVDTNTLFVDAANNRVGVGTASPTDPLHVEGASLLLKNGTGNVDLKLGITGYGMSLTYATGALRFRTNGADQMTLDNSGNLGLGVTPSAWGGSFKAIDLVGGSVASGGTSELRLYSNAYFNGTSTLYRNSAAATLYQGNSGQHLWYTAASGTAGNAISFTQAMTLDASGNLLVGTAGNIYGSSGRGLIEINGSSNSFLGFKVGDASKGYIQHGGTNLNIVNETATGVILFSTNATERARITSGGYFKASDAGTYFSSTGSYHELRSSANDLGVVITATASGYTSTLVYANTSTAAGTGFNLMALEANSVGQFRVRGDGTIYAQNTTVQSISDARLKENVVTSAQGLDVITALRPVRYDWKAGHGNDRKNQLGFIAQEVEPVFADAVDEWEMDGETYKTVGPAALIPVLVKAIQELDTRLKALEA